MAKQRRQSNRQQLAEHVRASHVAGIICRECHYAMQETGATSQKRKLAMRAHQSGWIVGPNGPLCITCKDNPNGLDIGNVPNGVGLGI